MSGLSLLWAVPASAIIAGANNAGNQLLFTGSVGDSRSFQGAMASGAMAGVFGLGNIGLNGWLNDKGMRALSFVVGSGFAMATNSGVPSNEKTRCETANCSEYDL